MSKKYCVGCGNEIPSKRVEILPHTKTCVNCSTTEKKGGMIIQLGEGDHTCTELIVMDREDLEKIENIKNKGKKTFDEILPDDTSVDDEFEEDEDLPLPPEIDPNTID